MTTNQMNYEPIIMDNKISIINYQECVGRFIRVGGHEQARNYNKTLVISRFDVGFPQSHIITINMRKSRNLCYVYKTMYVLYVIIYTLLEVIP